VKQGDPLSETKVSGSSSRPRTLLPQQNEPGGRHYSRSAAEPLAFKKMREAMMNEKRGCIQVKMFQLPKIYEASAIVMITHRQRKILLTCKPLTSTTSSGSWGNQTEMTLARQRVLLGKLPLNFLLARIVLPDSNGEKYSVLLSTETRCQGGFAVRGFHVCFDRLGTIGRNIRPILQRQQRGSLFYLNILRSIRPS